MADHGNATPSRPGLTCSRSDARAKIERQVHDGEELQQRIGAVSSEDGLHKLRDQYSAWDGYSQTLLETICTGDYLAEKYVPVEAARFVTSRTTLRQKTADLSDGIRTRLRDLKSIVAQLELLPEPEVATGVRSVTRRVFIIHGHDQKARLELEALLRREFPKLTPVVLSYEPGRGRELLAKFEEVAATCDFAFAIFTPDDFVQEGDKGYYQMRPNVVFELGWFRGRLTPAQTCMLFRGDSQTQLPSDLAGLVWVGFRDSLEEAFLSIRNELTAWYGDDIA